MLWGEMTSIDPRLALERLVRERGEDYAGLSRLIGRNAAYVQQFVKRGTPRQLAEGDRRTLARYFAVDESVLGGPAVETGSGLVPVPRLDVQASAGPGAIGGDEREVGRLGFDAAWLKRVARDPAMVSMIEVKGDSMAPTLADGDEILVDRSESGRRLRDGIFVLRMEDGLLVKRLAPDPSGGGLAVRSDNPAYPSWQCAPDGIDIVGRVVWAGRRIG